MPGNETNSLGRSLVVDVRLPKDMDGDHGDDAWMTLYEHRVRVALTRLIRSRKPHPQIVLSWKPYEIIVERYLTTRQNKVAELKSANPNMSFKEIAAAIKEANYKDENLHERINICMLLVVNDAEDDWEFTRADWEDVNSWPL